MKRAKIAEIRDRQAQMDLRIVDEFDRGQREARDHIEAGPAALIDMDRRAHFAYMSGYAAVMTESHIPPWHFDPTRLPHSAADEEVTPLNWHCFVEVWNDAYTIAVDAFYANCKPHEIVATPDLCLLEAEMAVVRFLRARRYPLIAAAHASQRIVTTMAKIIGEYQEADRLTSQVA